MPAGDTSLRFATGGDPGNQGDTVVMNNGNAIKDNTTWYGAVSYSYADGNVRRYGSPVLPVPQRGGDDSRTPDFLDTPDMTNGGGVVVNGYPVACGIIRVGSSAPYSYRPATPADSTGGVHFPAVWANLPVNWEILAG